MRARTEAMRNGEAKITVDVQNAQPEMQMLIKTLFEFVQVKANAEGLEVLV